MAVREITDIELENLTTVAPRTMTAGEVATQAVKNIPGSAIQYGTDIAVALADPIGTAKSIGQLGAGIVQLLIPGEQANEQQAKAVGQYFANRYGGMENLKRTIATDPVGFLGDASILITGGAALASKVAPLKQVAEKAKKAGQAIDPLAIASKPVSATLESGLGLTTGVGREAVQEAYRAGVAGGKPAKEFTTAMRQKDSLKGIVDEAKRGVTEMAGKRKAEYLKSMEGIKASTKKINFTPILQEVDNIRKSFEFEGQTTLDTGGLKKLQEVENAVLDWSVDPKFHTVEGLDALKKKIDNLMPEAETFGKTSGKGANVVTRARTIVNKKIKEASPEYAKATKAYEEAIGLEKEIRQSLSVGNKASADAALRKLLSVMRNNANTNFGVRLENLKKLEEAGGVSLTPSLAGASLSQLTPRGIQGTLTPYGVAGLGATGAIPGPQLAGLLAASSPRIVGETAFKAGQVGRFLPPSAVTRQAGVIEQQIGGDDNLTLAALQRAFNIGRQPQ